MRYDEVVKFREITDEKKYDSKTGRYIPVMYIKLEVLADVTDISMTDSVEFFGSYNTQAKIIRIQVPYNGNATHVEYRNRLYKIEGRKLNNRAFICSTDSIGIEKVPIDA